MTGLKRGKMPDIKVYIASVTGSMKIRKETEIILRILEGKKFEFETIDIATIDGAKEKMRELAGNATLIPPQIFNKDMYCGDFAAFDMASEDGELKSFLKVE